MITVVLLLIANIFMTFAWYGHLKFKTSPLWAVIVVSWLIAFVEYCFQVPANRIGYRTFSAAQLKILQEILTLTVFFGFSYLYLGERLRWNEIVGFVLIVLAVAFVFGFGSAKPKETTAASVRREAPAESPAPSPAAASER